MTIFWQILGLTALAILSKVLLAEKTPSVVIRTEQDKWSLVTKYNQAMHMKNFLNQDKGTFGAD